MLKKILWLGLLRRGTFEVLEALLFLGRGQVVGCEEANFTVFFLFFFFLHTFFFSLDRNVCVIT